MYEIFILNHQADIIVVRSIYYAIIDVNLRIRMSYQHQHQLVYCIILSYGHECSFDYFIS